MRGFWSDEDGLTVLDVLALAFGAAAIGTYIWFRSMDTNFADICIGIFIGVTGQRVGVRIASRIGKGDEDGRI